MIKEIAFVVYTVTDMARARAFYEKTLGLSLGETFGESWIEYDVAGVTFAITNGFGDGTPASSVAFEVDDLEAELARLKAQGVPVEGGIHEFEPCRMVLIKDPDGNTLCIHQRKR
jgi:predicted enzyme related to lactoylglutathione lyase